MGPRSKVLITAAELTELLRAGDPVTILDVRWSLKLRTGIRHIVAGTCRARCTSLSKTSCPTTPCPAGAAILCRPAAIWKPPPADGACGVIGR